MFRRIFHVKSQNRVSGNLCDIARSILLCVWLCSTLVYSDNTLAEVEKVPTNTITDESAFPYSPNFQVFEDINEEFAFETVTTLPDEHWQNMTSEQASFGFKESPFWLRTVVSNQSEQVKNFIIELDYPLLDSVVFRSVKDDGSISELTIGDTLAFNPRHIDHPSNLFQFQLAPKGSITIFMRVQTEGSMLLPLQVWQEQAFFEAAAIEQKIHFYYYGSVSVIILINIAVFFTLRERLYLYYAVAIAGYLLFFSTSHGYFFQIFAPNAPDLNSRLFLISMPGLALFSILFARQFLKTAEHSPKMDVALKAMVVFECFNLTLAILGSYDLVVRVSAVGAVLLFTVLFISGPVTFFKRKRTGAYFTIAWTPLTIGFFAASGRTSGFLPNNFLTEYAMQIGSGIEAVILTLALADRLYREREKKITAQAESLEVEKQRRVTQSLLTEAMSRDPVTQLSNRNRFEWMVQNTIDADPNIRYIVAVAKVTRLDEITHTLGLSSVEKILRQVASQMNDKHCAMQGAIFHTTEKGEREGVYQLSRDTFGCFMQQDIFEQAPDVYYDILRGIAEPIEFQGLTVDLSPIYGSALYPKHGNEPALLIRNAFIAMKESRHSKGMIGVFHEKLDIYDEKRLILVTELKEALENDELELYYQPKLDIKTGDVVGMEGLARWIHPTRGFIPPDEFVQLAEEAGLIHLLTLWAFDRAIRDLIVLRQQGYSGSISVNISARDLFAKNFSEKMQAILQKHDMAAEYIYLELTETGAMEDLEAGIAMLNSLANLGLKIAIDDFGTGYSSLSYLQRLPATEIKLDRSLIKDICECDSTAIIVKTSIDMVHALGYTLVAEGIEDQNTVTKLSEYECDSVQGFFYCKPKPFVEIKEWLSAR